MYFYKIKSSSLIIFFNFTFQKNEFSVVFLIINPNNATYFSVSQYSTSMIKICLCLNV